MFISKRMLMPGFSLLTAAALFTGCERVQTLTKKLKVTRESASTAAVAASSDPVTAIDASTYADFVSRKNKLVIVDFYADWCGPCKQMGPVLEKAVAAYPGVVCLGKVNVDQAGQLAAEQRVNGIPDVRFFKDGKQVDQFVGFPGEAAVLQKIDALAKGIAPAAPAAPPPATPAPAASSEPKIQPMKKDWLPPGMEKR